MAKVKREMVEVKKVESEDDEISPNRKDHQSKEDPASTTKVKKEESPEETSSSGTSASDPEEEPELEAANTGRLVDWQGQTIPTTASTDINNRLTSFFSQLAEKRANPDGEDDEIIEHGAETDSGYEEDDDGKQYVELDLALGVLSEKEDEEDDEVKLPKTDGGDQQDGSSSDEEALQNLKSIKRRQRGRGGKAKRRMIVEVAE